MYKARECRKLKTAEGSPHENQKRTDVFIERFNSGPWGPTERVFPTTSPLLQIKIMCIVVVSIKLVS